MASGGSWWRDKRLWRGEMNEERYGVMGTKVISAVSISSDVVLEGDYAPL